MNDFLKTSCFANFGAEESSLFVQPLVLTKDLLSVNAEFVKKKFIDSGCDSCAVFGDYSLAGLELIQKVSFIDFPNPKNRFSDNVRHELTDSWAVTPDNLFEAYKDKNSLFILTEEFLASQIDPRPILLGLKKIAIHSKVSILFLCQQDVAGYLSWKPDQLNMFFCNSGFSVEHIAKQVWYLSACSESYGHFLLKKGFRSELAKSRVLLISTEDATLRPTGGIGTYVKNIKCIDPTVAVLVCDLAFGPEMSGGSTFVVRDLIGDIDYLNLRDGLGLIEAVRNILYLLPNITIVEFQDYTAIGFRVVQARETGILPFSLWLRVFLHGNVDYLKYGAKNEASLSYSEDEIQCAIKDSYIFSKVDQAIAPSEYLGKFLMMEEYGYQFQLLEIKKLPFDLATIGNLKPIELNKVRQIAFIGKFSQLKGWPDFVSAIARLGMENKLKEIEKIVILAPGEMPSSDFELLTKFCKLEIRHLPHNQLIEFLKMSKNYTLFVVPSGGENYPFVILEQILVGTLFIGYSSGGAKEVVNNSEFTDIFFVEPNSTALYEKISQLLNENLRNKAEFINKFSSDVFKRQEQINSDWLKELKRPYNRLKKNLVVNEICNQITIVIPVFNTELRFLGDLLKTVSYLRITPKEVVIIDDGSSGDYHDRLEHLCSTFKKLINIRILRQTNSGLASARNLGLQASTTEYTYFIDSDDLLLPNALEDAWVAMQLNNKLIISGGFNPYFQGELHEIAKSRSQFFISAFWKPIGLPDSKVLSLMSNQYLSACGIVRTNLLRELGGWDASDKATWEDWALYSRLAWGGYDFSLIPWIAYLYRDTPGSMSKTYNRFLGQRRLVRNIALAKGLSKLEANTLVTLLNRPVLDSVSDLEWRLISIKRLLLSKIRKILRIRKLFGFNR